MAETNDRDTAIALAMPAMALPPAPEVIDPEKTTEKTTETQDQKEPVAMVA